MAKKSIVRFAAALLLAIVLGVVEASAQLLMFVTEFDPPGNIRAFDYTTGAPVALPPGYTPPGGVSVGSDGMTTDSFGRLYVNRGNGTIYRRSLDGLTFSVFSTIAGSPTLLDATINSTHLFAAHMGAANIYRVSLADGTYTTLPGPSGFSTADGVRIGPDGRLYAVDSSDGQIFAYDLATSTWSTFLSSAVSGDASQMEFYGDHVFVSRTVLGEGRIYRYTLNVPGNYAAGLDPTTETLIGNIGSTLATGIRIGPDNRLYANGFNSGTVWRSNVGITAMESSPFITGLTAPASIHFAMIPEPGTVGVLAVGAAVIALATRRYRRRQR